MPERPRFSVIIPHRDDLPGLELSLTSLAALDPRTPAFEVIVADNGSNVGMDAVHAVTADFAQLDLYVVEAFRAGAAHARNAGVRAARGSILAFLDCDCIPDKDWLIRADALLQSEADFVGGPLQICLRPGAREAVTAAEMFDFLYACDVEVQYRRRGLLLTANLIARRQAFDRAGEFRDLVSEDRDWCDRARAASLLGKFDGDLVVRHVATVHALAQRKRWRRRTRETWHYGREHGVSRWRWLAYCCAVSLSPLVHGFRVVHSPALRGRPFRLRLATLALLWIIRLERAMVGICLPVAELRAGGRDKGKLPTVKRDRR